MWIPVLCALAQEPSAPPSEPPAGRAWAVGTAVAVGVNTPGWLGVGALDVDFLAVEGRWFAPSDRLSVDVQVHPGQTLVSGLVGFPTVPVSGFAHLRFPVKSGLEAAVAPGGTIAVGGGAGVGFVHVLATARVGVDLTLPKSVGEVGAYLRPTVGVYGLGAGPAAFGGGAAIEATYTFVGRR